MTRRIVLGDFNDYIQHDGHPDTGHALSSLLDDGFSINLLDRLQQPERWTHYYPKEDTKHQIDYILASPSIASKNPDAKPDIIRFGQPYRVPGMEKIYRYPRIGFDRPKASDHCPVAVTIEI